jgi:hypothetical protein
LSILNLQIHDKVRNPWNYAQRGNKKKGNGNIVVFEKMHPQQMATILPFPSFLLLRQKTNEPFPTGWAIGTVLSAMQFGRLEAFVD